METQSAIASNLARLRADRGLTQADLAKRAHLSRVALGKIERGDVTPRPDTLAELAPGSSGTSTRAPFLASSPSRVCGFAQRSE